MNISLQKARPENAPQRLKGYKMILFGQIMTIVNFLFLYELFLNHPFENWETLIIMLTGLLMTLMNIFAYLLIKELTNNPLVAYTVLFLLFAGTISGIFSGLPIFDVSMNIKRALTITTMVSSLISFTLVMYFMLYDVFNENHDIVYRLWGCASIYLLFGGMFGVLYALLEITLPVHFQIMAPLEVFHVVLCFNLSLYTLSGIDSPFEDFSLLVKNITVIESIFSNLYIVLVVGRLLSK